MKVQDQIELDRIEARSTKASPKTILLHLQGHESVDARLEAALSLARACSAHLECLHITSTKDYMAFDGMGGVFVMNDVLKAMDREATDLRVAVESKLRREDVSWSYAQVSGDLAGRLVSHAALADLMVVGRAPRKDDLAGSKVGLLGELLYRSRTPLFVAPDADPEWDHTQAAMIAWDGSYEAANAVRSSVGLLRLASSVHVLQITEARKDEAFPSTRLLEYLSRHDVHADYSAIDAGPDNHDQAVISDRLASRALALRASYLVMGGYNHSRVGEYVFGGVTRTMLTEAPFPLVIAR